MKVHPSAGNDLLLNALGTFSSFQLSSQQATDALDAASSSLEWRCCKQNADVQVLGSARAECLPTVLDRESLWQKYNSFHVSKNFFILWDKFLKKGRSNLLS